MRILHLSWEYPPVIYGGLGRHVHAIAAAQAAAGHEVVVLTQAIPADGAACDALDDNGVRVVRVARDAPEVPLDVEHLIAWILGFNSALSRGYLRLLRTWQPDVVHGHDWLVAHALMLAGESAPTVLTMHATEAGRHQGWMPSELSRQIHAVEWWATNQAGAVIACSEHMRQEVVTLFEVPAEHVCVIPNGVDGSAWRVTTSQRRKVRQRYPGPLIAFTGRLEWEKGVHTLIDAMPAIRRAVPDAHLVIAGRGSTADDLRRKVRARRLGKAVTFEGWLPEADLHALVAAADVAVVPSIYEPFGIVALEAAAVGTPVVVADSGGLAEIVQEGRTGWLFAAGDPADLARCAIEALADPTAARRRARAGKQRVAEVFAWPRIARMTEAVYKDVIQGRRPPAWPQADFGAGPALHTNLLARRDQSVEQG